MNATRRVNPFKCRMWTLHDRLGESITVESCASLIESLRKHAQKRAVLARPLQHDATHDFELIYGARRLFAAQHLGIELLVEVCGIDDRTALVEMDIENRVRADISPYERGLSYKSWLRGGHFSTQTELARAIGISEAQVSRLLRYAELPTALLSAFASPRDIREEWAVVLAKRCGEADGREQLIRHARAVAASARRLTPQETYEALLAAPSKVTVRSMRHDRIVRGGSGKPILRVSVRAKSVHLIVPRDAMTPSCLEEAIASVTGVLDRPSEPREPMSARETSLHRRRFNGLPT